LRAREIWVEGANRYRNPDNDLSTDWSTKRDTYYEALHRTTDADEFILRKQPFEALGAFQAVYQQLAPPQNELQRQICAEACCGAGAAYLALSQCTSTPRRKVLSLLRIANSRTRLTRAMTAIKISTPGFTCIPYMAIPRSMVRIPPVRTLNIWRGSAGR
jgi:hypothetical protein